MGSSVFSDKNDPGSTLAEVFVDPDVAVVWISGIANFVEFGNVEVIGVFDGFSSKCDRVALSVRECEIFYALCEGCFEVVYFFLGWKRWKSFWPEKISRCQARIIKLKKSC